LAPHVHPQDTEVLPYTEGIHVTSFISAAYPANPTHCY